MPEARRALEVVAALIVRDGRFLACQRPPEKARGLFWEFPGGKVEPGECGDQAIVRECREELGVTLRAIERVMDVTHDYPDLTVHLTLYRCEIERGEPQRIEYHDLRWMTAQEIDMQAFCPADRAFCAAMRDGRLTCASR